jgi:D-serine dehydratase
MLDSVVEAAELCDRHGYFAEGDVILTAGGSAYFDLVCNRLKHVTLGRRHTLVLRSGCYLTHDDGFYDNAVRELLKREGPDRRMPGKLSPALEVWAYVQSTPEPGLAILTLGKRDVSYDIHLPRPTQRFRPGHDMRPVPLAGVNVFALNDQHAFASFGETDALATGDMVSVGISHPCTTFDKWRLMFIVDDDYNVVDAITTCF